MTTGGTWPLAMVLTSAAFPDPVQTAERVAKARLLRVEGRSVFVEGLVAERVHFAGDAASMTGAFRSHGEFLIDQGRFRRIAVRFDMKTTSGATELEPGQLYVLQLVEERRHR